MGSHAQAVERESTGNEIDDQRLAREVARWVMDLPDREEAIARLRQQVLMNNFAPETPDIVEAIIAEGDLGHR